MDGFNRLTGEYTDKDLKDHSAKFKRQFNVTSVKPAQWGFYTF